MRPARGSPGPEKPIADRSGKPRYRHRNGLGDSTPAPPAPGLGGPSPFTPVRSLSFVCPVGFSLEPRPRQRILQSIGPYAPYSSARGRSRGGVHGLEHASLRPRLVCAALSRLGCHGKAALGPSRARPPGLPVGNTLGGFQPGEWPCVGVCVAPSRRQVPEIVGMCSHRYTTGTRPSYREHTPFPWHEGVGGARPAHLDADKARQAVNCGRCEGITAPP